MSQPLLHEVIAKVLNDAGQPLTAKEIAEMIAKKQLWLRPSDKKPPEHGQINARVNNYGHLFEKIDRKICLKTQPESHDRLFRLTWNTTGWQYPVKHKWDKKHQGKNDVAFENQYGFGGEEWLFNPRYILNGYQYGYIRGVQDLAAEVRVIPTAYLYTFDQTARERYLVGKIANLEVIKSDPALMVVATKLYNRYINEVKTELGEAEADIGGLTAYGLLPNIRFQITGDELLEEMQPAPGLDGHHYKRFMPYIVNAALQTIIDGAMPDNEFIFRPGVANSSKDFERNNTKTTQTIIRLHSDITKALEKYLAPEYSKTKKNLSIEKTGFGKNTADVVLAHNLKEITILEVKTSGLARKNIREALGQLLDYACWHTKLTVRKLVIVSPSILSKRELELLHNIRKQVHIPLAYCQYLANPGKGEPAFIEVIA